MYQREFSLERKRKLHRGWYDTPDLTARNHECCQEVRDVYAQSEGYVYMYVPLDIWLGGDLKHGDLDKQSEEVKDLIRKIEKEFRDWVTFGRQCLFPIHYVGLHDLGYCNGVAWGGLSMKVKWNLEDISQNHMSLACLSFIRYFYSETYKGMPDAVYAIKNAYPHLTHTEALILGHYLAPETYTGYYGLVNSEYIFLPMTNADLFKRLASGNVNSKYTIGSRLVGSETYGKVKRKIQSNEQSLEAAADTFTKLAKDLNHEIRI